MEDFLSKIEVLVRLGLMPIEDLPYLKKALGHVKQNMYLPVQERRVFYKFVNDMLKITLDSPALTRLIMNKTGALKHVNESVKKKKKFTLKGDKRTDNGPSSIGDIQNAPPTGYEETDMLGQKLIEHVRKRGNKYVVTNEAGTKTLGTHPNRASAVKQLQAIEAHKHMDESVEPIEETIYTITPSGRVVGRYGKLKVSGYKKYTDALNAGDIKKAQAISKRNDTNTKKKTQKEEVDLTEEINVRKLPTNTLRALANAATSKKKAGGHVTTHDKQLASLARKELNRRKNLGESVDYTERFEAALTHFGVKDINELDIETTKDFLKFVDTQNEMVISANSQKKLTVSDAHKERAAQDMLARAHMKDRLMAKASAEYKDAIKPKEKSDARKLFMRDRKSMKVESVVVEDAGSRNATSPVCTYCGGKLQTTKENKKTQGHSGKCTNCGKMSK
jgi:hypothetical protein